MLNRIRHECGGNAHLIGKSAAVGWNMYCCDYCGAVFFKWITKEFLIKVQK